MPIINANWRNERPRSLRSFLIFAPKVFLISIIMIWTAYGLLWY